jgi:hypothetical protein
MEQLLLLLLCNAFQGAQRHLPNTWTQARTGSSHSVAAGYMAATACVCASAGNCAPLWRPLNMAPADWLAPKLGQQSEPAHT